MSFEQFESLPDWFKFGACLLCGGLILSLVCWADYSIKRLEARELALRLSEAGGRHKRLMCHLRHLTSDLERRLINRRDVLEELKVCLDVHGGKVDPYTTGCRGEGRADVAN